MYCITYVVYQTRVYAHVGVYVPVLDLRRAPVEPMV
jgi:hypothetical protein